MALLDATQSARPSGQASSRGRPKQNFGRFLKRAYLIAKSSLLHPNTITLIEDMPDGSIRAREVARGRR